LREAALIGGRRSVAGAIGNTPLIELPTLSPKRGVRIFAKLEGANPSGSVKDRVARSMLDDAEACGALAPGQALIEPSSGNTGIALAMLCAARGYPLTVVLPENVSRERRALLHAYGAEIVLSEGWLGSNGAIARARTMLATHPEYYSLDQYANEANPRAHYDGTAIEILEELPEPAAFVAGLGTGGTLTGNGRRLREELGDRIQIVAAEPMQGEWVQGLRSLDDGFVPPVVDLGLLDRKILVSNYDAVCWTRRLLEQEGLFLGVSSGAIASIAVRIAREMDDGDVVFVAPDNGWKYMSTGVYSKPLDEIKEALETSLLW
jgi:cysteine synthase B